MAVREMSYIELIATVIWRKTQVKPPRMLWYPEDESSLWLGYAVLALAKGIETTSEDVHDAWSAWAVVHHDGEHRSLIPFDQLSEEVQAYDDFCRDAIHQVVPMIPELL